MLNASKEHVLKLVLVFGRHQHHVRDGAQVRNIEHTLVGASVVAYHASTVHRKDHRQVLYADIVDDLVVRALQESRVDGDHRLDALGGQPRRECYRMLLGDTNIEEAFRKHLGELVK